VVVVGAGSGAGALNRPTIQSITWVLREWGPRVRAGRGRGPRGAAKVVGVDGTYKRKHTMSIRYQTQINA
jgi:hypothetical protein